MFPVRENIPHSVFHLSHSRGYARSAVTPSVLASCWVAELGPQANSRLTIQPSGLRIDKVLPKSGPVAQLGARFHGMEEVIGSIPIRSTKQPLTNE
jgi:hypothetical protein